MRPLRLELEGFASFKEHTVIDFEGADLFVLSGPMGAGKSSIIDAMGFALYGSVSRYNNAGLVAPVINQSSNQMRVRLDFLVNDCRYTAVRIVRRGVKGGAQMAEARLLKGSELIGEKASEVTDEVERLLGLNFDQYNKCIVLPQGDFSELLHAKPAERQDLLVRLLDIGFYRNIGTRARERHGQSDAAVKFLESRLDNDLRTATEETYKAAEKRLRALEKLDKAFAADETALQGQQARLDTARVAAKAAEGRAKQLSTIKTPPGIADLSSRLGQAQESASSLREAYRLARDVLEAQSEARSALPERSAIEAVAASHADLEKRRGLLGQGEAKLALAGTALREAEQRVVEAQEAVEAAEAKRERLSQAHSAYHAARDLKVGDICPVCGEKLTAPPNLEEPEGMAEVNAALEAGRKTVKAAREAQARAQTEFTQREASITQEKENQTRIEAQLAGQPDPNACKVLLGQIEAAERTFRAASEDEKQLRTALAEAEQALADVDKESNEAWSVFLKARDPVAADGAPTRSPDGIEASWSALTAWIMEFAEQQTAVARQAALDEAAATAEMQTILARQDAACVDAGVVLSGQRPRDALLATKGAAEQQLKYIDERLAERASVEKDMAESVETRRVAGTLADHLQKTRFERWYLQEALNRLVKGASERLKELSDGQYSIGLNPNGTDFVVVDHINADEERPVRTLSGGETFLASLSLALALGEDIASLATNGAARLDALFLDEGFGSLDPNTLETVASTIEELGARGRMVGLVTHVRELAERVPVQYQVMKERGSSRVQRVEVG